MGGVAACRCWRGMRRPTGRGRTRTSGSGATPPSRRPRSGRARSAITSCAPSVGIQEAGRLRLPRCPAAARPSGRRTTAITPRQNTMPNAPCRGSPRRRHTPGPLRTASRAAEQITKAIQAVLDCAKNSTPRPTSQARRVSHRFENGRHHRHSRKVCANMPSATGVRRQAAQPRHAGQQALAVRRVQHQRTDSTVPASRRPAGTGTARCASASITLSRSGSVASRAAPPIHQGVEVFVRQLRMRAEEGRRRHGRQPVDQEGPLRAAARAGAWRRAR